MSYQQRVSVQTFSSLLLKWADVKPFNKYDVHKLSFDLSSMSLLLLGGGLNIFVVPTRGNDPI